MERVWFKSATTVESVLSLVSVAACWTSVFMWSLVGVR